MKRVSTAFVGQVSAASSPAVAKLKGRPRDQRFGLRAAREQPSRAVAPASRPWSRSFSTHSAVARPCRSYSSRVRKAAELTTAAERLGARVLAGDAAMDLELLVKMEGEARRAVRALNLKTAAKRGPTFAEVGARIAAGGGRSAARNLTPVALVPTLKTLKTRF
jgi:hypothetical protein